MASIFAFLHNVYATLLVIANFIQHLFVNITTMQHVLFQPHLPDNSETLQGTCNNLCTLRQYKISYAKARNFEIGTISSQAGMIQLQVFNSTTQKRLKLCVLLSTVYLIFSGLMLFYCLSWTISLLMYCGLCGAAHDVEGDNLLLYY